MVMKRALDKWVGIGVGAALLVFGSAAIAGPTSEWNYIGDFQAAVSTEGLATKHFESATGLGTNFDSASWNGATSTASTLTLDAQTAAATDTNSDVRRRALAASSDAGNSSPVVGSTASLDLTLWNFINSVRAQQTNNQFIQLKTAATNIDITLNDIPAPVPLPQASWLFAGGLAALVIARRIARRTRAGTTSTTFVAA